MASYRAIPLLLALLLALIAPTAQAGAPAPTCMGRTPAAWSALGYRVIVGTEGNDKLTGSTRKDVLFGLGGNDYLYGGVGDDILCGGAGDDFLSGGPNLDTLDGGPGDDTLHGDDAADLLIGGEGDDELRGGSGYDTLIGDCLTGDGEEDCLTAGDDALWGGPAIDLLIGDSARATNVRAATVARHALVGRYCGTCIDRPDTGVVTIGGMAYELYGDGDDVLYGESGGGGEVLNTPELLYGGGGDDVLSGGDGDEYLYGGPGDDTLYGGPGTDWMYGGDGSDACDGGPNNPGPLVDAAIDCEAILNVP